MYVFLHQLYYRPEFLYKSNWSLHYTDDIYVFSPWGLGGVQISTAASH